MRNPFFGFVFAAAVAFPTSPTRCRAGGAQEGALRSAGEFGGGRIRKIPAGAGTRQRSKPEMQGIDVGFSKDSEDEIR